MRSGLFLDIIRTLCSSISGSKGGAVPAGFELFPIKYNAAHPLTDWHSRVNFTVQGPNQTQFMKSICALLFAFSILAADAQLTNAPAPNPASLPNVDQWSLTGVITHPEQTPLL